MKNNLKHWQSVIAAVSIVAGLMAGSVSRVWAEGNPYPAGIIPPNTKPYGMTYGEWSARWWQWAFMFPVDKNPFFDGDYEYDNNDEDNNCTNGANGQLGPVWFLTGVVNTSGTAERNCTVPAGKALFFPLINVECSTLEAPPFYGSNEAELRTCATTPKIENVFAKIDGMPVQNLRRYLKASPLFNFTVPPNNVLGVDPNFGQSVSSGYWLMLAPLSVGKHTIHFGGTFPDFNFTLNITYNLKVVPGKP